MIEKLKRRFYDSHPELPLDPDTDRLKPVRPIHADSVHIAIVAIGAFLGTLLRYEMGAWWPTGKEEWPLTTFLINVAGAFLLGVLLQILLSRGKDEGGRRALRLIFGAGFLGAFTTYSSLATSTVLLAQSNHLLVAFTYTISSVVGGIFAAMFGIYVGSISRSKM